MVNRFDPSAPRHARRARTPRLRRGLALLLAACLTLPHLTGVAAAADGISADGGAALVLTGWSLPEDDVGGMWSLTALDSLSPERRAQMTALLNAASPLRAEDTDGANAAESTPAEDADSMTGAESTPPADTPDADAALPERPETETPDPEAPNTDASEGADSATGAESTPPADTPDADIALPERPETETPDPETPNTDAPEGADSATGAESTPPADTPDADTALPERPETETPDPEAPNTDAPEGADSATGAESTPAEGVESMTGSETTPPADAIGGAPVGAPGNILNAPAARVRHPARLADDADPAGGSPAADAAAAPQAVYTLELGFTFAEVLARYDRLAALEGEALAGERAALEALLPAEVLAALDGGTIPDAVALARAFAPHFLPGTIRAAVRGEAAPRVFAVEWDVETALAGAVSIDAAGTGGTLCVFRPLRLTDESGAVYAWENVTLTADPAAPAVPLALALTQSGARTTAIDQATLDRHIVPGLDPENTVVNVFDYWIHEESGNPSFPAGDLIPNEYKHIHRRDGTINQPASATVNASDYRVWDKGINDGHLLLFGDGLIHAGLWNKGAGSGSVNGFIHNIGADRTKHYAWLHAGMEDIVRPFLIDGYPAINTPLAMEQLADYTIVPDALLASDCFSDNKDLAIYPSPIWWIPYNLSKSLLIFWGNRHGLSLPETSSPEEIAAAATPIVESLDYLFDPSTEDIQNDSGGPSSVHVSWDPATTTHQRNKRAYRNVHGLFQLDEEGYYYYNMRENYAHLKVPAASHGGAMKPFNAPQTDAQFVLYDAPATNRTDGSGEASVGNFLPFNEGSWAFTGENADHSLIGDQVDPQRNEANHYFGMTVETDFRQSVNGLINMGTEGDRPLTFEFSGDDDVWVFIDDVLVLDLGGIHSEIYGIIDFHTGEVFSGRSFLYGGIPTYEPWKYDYDQAIDPFFGPHEVPLKWGTGDDQQTIYTEPTHIANRTTIKAMFLEAAEAAREALDALPADATEAQRAQYQAVIDAVDRVQWNGDTFPSNSDHTLKMFYLERGNYDSSLAVRFNLQPQLYQQLKKVDQYGNALGDVEFKLYPAETTTEADPNALLCSNAIGASGAKSDTVYVRLASGADLNNPLTTLTTDADGLANFTDPNASTRAGADTPFNFTDRYNPDTGEGQFYILRESDTPPGFRSLPTDIVLEYNPATTLLSVANRWRAGAYGSFTSTDTGLGTVTYGHYDETTGEIQPSTDKAVAPPTQAQSLIVAIPMLKQYHDPANPDSVAEDVWLPIYGSNTSGQQTVRPRGADVAAWREASLAAVLYQAADERSSTPEWFLPFHTANNRLEGTLMDLPGRADRYLFTNPGGDMRMVYAILTPEALAALNISVPNGDGAAQARYEALGAYVRARAAGGKSLEEAVWETVDEIMAVSVPATGSGKGFSFLNVDQFNHIYRSLIYVSNEQRELRVQKVDQNGVAVNGAEFTLYPDAACLGTPLARGTTAHVNGRDGMLIFQPRLPAGASDGYAAVNWGSEGSQYYLQETASPAGYGVNRTVIPVVVSRYGIYADAGTPDDGVTVMAGVGKLSQPMVKYAIDSEVDITLRDITAFGQAQPSGAFRTDGWQDVALAGTDGRVRRSMNLHFGKNAVVDYGLHDEDGGKNISPFFVTDTGFLRARVEQNYAALTSVLYGDAYNDVAKDDLTGIDLTQLFSLLNIVVVTDRTDADTPTGGLTLTKEVAGAELHDTDFLRNFTFSVELTDADGAPLPGEYYFYGTDKSGFVRHGDSIPMHHDESLTILGLPAGARFKITEDAAAGWETTVPATGVISGTVTANVNFDARYLNNKLPRGDLSLTKAVTGDLGETDREFVFLLSLTRSDGRPAVGVYEYTGSSSGQVRDGSHIRLRHGERITIHDLPEGITYRLVELEANEDGYVTTESGSTGQIAAGDTQNAVFVNHRASQTFGALTVGKTVTGAAGETDRDFHFTVALKNPDGSALAGQYAYTGGAGGMLSDGGELVLRHGQSVTVTGLPTGTRFTVRETEADTDGYATTATGAEGTIARDTTLTASFVNHRDAAPPTPDAPDAPETPETPDAPNAPDAPDALLPRTGLNWWPVLLLGAAGLTAVAAGLLLGRNRRKRDGHEA